MSRCQDPACGDYRCDGCGHDICPDAQPSPGEPDQICADCWSLEDDGAVAP